MNGCMGTGKKRIQILLSTYNGEKYLREQLDSYFSMEEYCECCVLIRDDGSTDGTCEILQEYERRSEIQIAYGENLGITGSYLWLLANSDKQCEYFALSDQDDVWLSDKFTIALSMLESLPQEQALLFASRSCITNSALKPIGFSVLPVRGISFYNAMIQNVLPGHTQVMNRILVEILLSRGVESVHAIDWWIYLVASGIGRVVYSEKCTVLHRQHGDNAVGYQVSLWGGLCKKLSYIRHGKNNAISCQLQAFYLFYQSEMPDEYRRETALYLAGLQSLPDRLRYLTICRVYRQNWSGDLAFRILYFLGKYALYNTEEETI